MARIYTLIDSTWRPRTLTRFLREWASRAQPRILEPVTGKQGVGSLEAHLFAEGSLRGVGLAMRGRAFRTGAIEISLGSMANLVDWGMAFGLIRALMEQGRGTLSAPDGASVPLERLTLTEAEAEGTGAMRLDASEIKKELSQRGRPWAALRFPRFDLFIVPADIPAVEDEIDFARALENTLLPRALRYHQAQPLEVMQAGDGTAFAIWRFESALVDQLGYVAVSRDVEEGAFVVRWNDVVALMKGRLEVAATSGRRYYLPALVPGNPQDDALVDRLIKAGADVDDFMQAHVMQIG
ncbi:MAG: hypothetical protein QNJ98_00015 [Planctomycetota bacterium]|nr:hypothetical protein [Planctomycetota bacterium]